MVLPPSQNTVGVCNQITLLVLYHNSSRLVTLLKIIDALIQIPNTFYVTVSFKFLNFSFQIFLLFVPEMSTSFTFFILSTLLWLESCIHCILACFLWSKKPKHSSTNHGLCCFNSWRPRLFLAGLIFSLMLSQALFMSSPPLKLSKATDLFVISIP